MCCKIRCDGYCAKFFEFWGHLNGTLDDAQDSMVYVRFECQMEERIREMAWQKKQRHGIERGAVESDVCEYVRE